MVEHVRKPDWLKIRLGGNEKFTQTKEIVESHALHTICTSGKCPNMGECWERGTATFMIGGEICTRSCKFCNTLTGKPLPLNPLEPENVALSIRLMNLKHAVITSVDRDDLPDLGADHWVKTIETVKKRNPGLTIEVLIPDFKGRKELIDRVINAAPDIISHNMETVRRLTPKIRSAAKYDVSLSVLKRIAERGVVAKTGMMVGLGETVDEIYELMDDVLAVGGSVLTIGQYLQPSRKHIPVSEYVHPDQFKMFKEVALEKGFAKVESAPLVRSSYHAEKHV
ncbi:MAG: lipoyl synthase [Massilibacteroides sp.]|nr:lipoyl synthase [Massilibacteroides sp.]MDD3063069.1 lipoyl synthase [Massilibacteroides sp.]MDD4114287.1 lipoyl synthase [Massilibacteroides sp.]MDD4660384.1 lipoyl synthase [Massilibacteroides sp.]